jgi:hypothetical protein
MIVNAIAFINFFGNLLSCGSSIHLHTLKTYHSKNPHAFLMTAILFYLTKQVDIST